MFENITSSPQNIILVGVGVIALLLFFALSLQVIFSKLGDEGWKAWVPVLNGWTFFTTAGMSGAWLFIVWVPIFGLVMTYIAIYKISYKLGYDGTGMVFLAIFFPFLWLLVVSTSHNKSDEELEAVQNRRDKRNGMVQDVPMSAGREWALSGVPVVQAQPQYPQPVQQYSAPQYAAPQLPPEPEQAISFGYNNRPQY